MVSFYVEFVFYDFFDKISAFWKAVICEKGKHSELAKAVSPSRALPLLATQLFSVVVGVNALTGCGIRGGVGDGRLCLLVVVDGKEAHLRACSLRVVGEMC